MPVQKETLLKDAGKLKSASSVWAAVAAAAAEARALQQLGADSQVAVTLRAAGALTALSAKLKLLDGLLEMKISSKTDWEVDCAKAAANAAKDAEVGAAVASLMKLCEATEAGLVSSADAAKRAARILSTNKQQRGRCVEALPESAREALGISGDAASPQEPDQSEPELNLPAESAAEASTAAAAPGALPVIPYSELEFDKGEKCILGKGSYGVVMKAAWRTVPVAVKEVTHEIGSKVVRLPKHVHSSVYTLIRCLRSHRIVSPTTLFATFFVETGSGDVREGGCADGQGDHPPEHRALPRHGG